MAFTMETSRTADAAKLAVLWRDRDKQPPAAGGGGSVPDHFVEDVFEGGILPEVIPLPAGPPTTNPDGSTTPGVVPEPTLVNHKTPYTDAKAPQLVSIYAAVQELRRIVASPAQHDPTDPLYPLTVPSADGGVAATSDYFGDGIRSTFADLRALTHGRGSVFGGPDGTQDRVEALRAANKSILDVLLDLRAATFGVFGPELTERIRDWIEANGVADRIPGINSGLLGAIESLLGAVDTLSRSLKFIDEQVLGTRVIPQLETAQKDIVSAEKRIRDLEERQSQLESRVGQLESGTSGQ